MMMPKNELPYRPCVGICLINADGLIFGGKRIDTTAEAWQMPQGGVDEGEAIEEAALRELGEETGLRGELVEYLNHTSHWLHYDLPPEIIGKLWGGKYRGQRQKWFAYRFLGDDQDVNINTEHPEFSDWGWLDKETMMASIVPFKKEIYSSVFQEFSQFLK